MSNDDSAYDFASPAPPSAAAQRQGELTHTPGVKPAPKGEDPEHTCPFCGHSYRGKPKARCSDCAAPLDYATDLLQFSDSAWVRTTALGLVLLVPGIALHIGGTILRWMGMHPAKGLFHVVAAMILAIGVFLLTRAERGTAARRHPLAVWARVGIVACLVIWLVLLPIALKLWSTSGGTLRGMVVLAMLCQAFTAICLAHVLAYVATRIPSDSLSTHSSYSGWLSAAACLAMAVIWALDLTTPVHLMFFTCSFPLIGGFAAVFAWAMITALRMALDMRVSANVGADIAARRAQRQASRNA